MSVKMLSFLVSLFFLTFNAQSGADQILGNWLATDHSVAVEVYQSKGIYKAKVVWFDDSAGSGIPMHRRTDTENPNPQLRNRKIIGMQVLQGLVYRPEKHAWENGRIYDATSGRHWDSSASITADGILKVRGFWKYKWIGRTMSFKRANDKEYTKL